MSNKYNKSHPMNSLVITKKFITSSRKNSHEIIDIHTIARLSWHKLQMLVPACSNMEDAQNLLYLYFTEKKTAKEIGFRGRDADIITLDDLSLDEREEIENYISIFNGENFSKHHEVNEYISKRGLWNTFRNIRSMNTHENGARVNGITPKHFKVVCHELEIEGEDGSKLINFERY